ncbi:hypothetical protein Sme01_62750 [Sphaerisporangium melleum]|nr:hypothetical protein Sme01_62750 [Sphaerisporangium melleum]
MSAPSRQQAPAPHARRERNRVVPAAKTFSDEGGKDLWPAGDERSESPVAGHGQCGADCKAGSGSRQTTGTGG